MGVVDWFTSAGQDKISDNRSNPYITKSPETVEQKKEVVAKAEANRAALIEPHSFKNKYREDYNIDQMMYPEDLMDASGQYGGNFAVFYINVHEDSYIIKDGSAKAVDGRASDNMRSAVSGRNIDTGGVAFSAGVAGGLAGAASNVTKSSVANVAIGVALAEAAVVGVGTAVAQYKQINSAIALHMPNDLSTTYVAGWSEDSQDISQALAEGGQVLVDAFKNRSFTAAAGMGDVAKGALVSQALKTPGAGKFLSKTSGVASNPKKEQLFQEIDFRTFTFSYQFFPRSSSEAKKVQRIIKTFKFHMHPEFKDGTAQFLYLYPSEFDIVYYQNGTENLNIHRHTSCVLTNMQVNYTPQSQFTVFEDGHPTQINLTMTFKELALLTKETIQQGY